MQVFRLEDESSSGNFDLEASEEVKNAGKYCCMRLTTCFSVRYTENLGCQRAWHLLKPPHEDTVCSIQPKDIIMLIAMSGTCRP